MMKLVLVALALVASASCQIYTQLGPDGYKYPKPQQRFEPEPPQVVNEVVEPACVNGGSGPFCCDNGADNVDCCENGGSGTYCCTNGLDTPDCTEPATPPPPPPFVHIPSLPKIIPAAPAPLPVKPAPLPVKPAPAPFQPRVQPEPEEPKDFYEVVTPPPLPSFIPPIPSFPKIIPAKPVVDAPAPFAPAPLPVKPQPIAQHIEARVEATTNAPEYLPPIDARNEVDEWAEWKAKHDKSYPSPEEEDKRRSIFESNLERIKKHNIEYDAGRSTFELEANKFCDLTSGEFVSSWTGIRGTKQRRGGSMTRSGFQGYDKNFGTSSHQVIPGHADPGSVFDEDARGRSFGSSVSGSISGNGGGSIGVSAGSFSGPSGSGSSIGFQSGGFGGGAGGFGDGSSARSNAGASDGFGGSGQNMTMTFMPSDALDKEMEDEVDWRKKGAVTPVKNQGGCASCWAFAANGALETQNFLKTGKLVSLSEQNLVDCVKDNDGCDGGYMTNAFHYIEVNPGVDTEASYPYEKKQSSCRFKRSDVGANLIGHMEVAVNNERALQQAVATVGPVAAGIDGGQFSFMFYKQGYYFEPKCGRVEDDVNHAVVVVGYGKTDAGEEYYICKNSWDTDWGESGYIRMARNKNNHCGITSLASYPLV